MLGVGDHRHVLLEEAVGGDQAAGLTVGAGLVVAVMAEVGHDVGEVGGSCHGAEVIL